MGDALEWLDENQVGGWVGGRAGMRVWVCVGGGGRRPLRAVLPPARSPAPPSLPPPTPLRPLPARTRSPVAPPPFNPAHSQDAEKEEFDEKLKEVQDVCNPIVGKVYAAGGGEAGACGASGGGGAARARV